MPASDIIPRHVLAVSGRAPLRPVHACLGTGLRRCDAEVGQTAHQKGDVIPAEAGIQTRQEDRTSLSLTQRRVAS